MGRGNSQLGYADLLGQFLRLTPEFRGKWRLVTLWLDKRKNATRTRVLPGGAKVLCDLSIPYEAMVWLEREEQQDLELLCLLLKPGQTFIDAGANIGIWTIVAASLVGSEGRVYAFEPNPFTYQKLSRNVSLQSSKPIIFNLALGDEHAELPFDCNKAHNISRILKEGEAVTRVTVKTLDSILGKEQVTGIKIDVEGFELEVLEGSKDILNRYKPWLCVEFNTVLSKVNELGRWPVHQYLSRLGYTCRLFKDALSVTPGTILTSDWRADGYCNLFYSIR